MTSPLELTSDFSVELQSSFSPQALRQAFFDRVAASGVRGIDRVSPLAFRERLDDHLGAISRKCLRGNYRFSPYLEVLRSKGPSKPPRVISIPTVRDRLVLDALKQILHLTFPSCVGRTLPNQYVREIARVFKDGNCAFVRADIKSFFDSIDQVKLLERVRARLALSDLRLVEKAVRNPTRARGARGKARLRQYGLGVPQGLAISNVLAEIFIQEVDAALRGRVVNYWRYIDDIVVLCAPGESESIYHDIAAAFSQIGLHLSDEKRVISDVAERVEFLGYTIGRSAISVRQTSIDNRSGPGFLNG